MGGDCQEGVASRHSLPQHNDLLVQRRVALMVGILISARPGRRLRWASRPTGSGLIDVGLDQNYNSADGMSLKVTHD
jgi:hypothetical protein